MSHRIVSIDPHSPASRAGIRPGDRLSSVNGETVVDGVTLENYWNRSKPIFPVEQIELQCHGDPLEWRNVFIKSL